MTDEARYEVARRVLTDTQYLTWAMAEKGISHRAIAYFRRVSKGTVTDCLVTCERKIEEALNGQDQDAASAGRGRA